MSKGGARDMAGAGGIWLARAGYGSADGIYSFRPFGAPPSYIGLPQKFCEAKDLWEEEQRASEQSR